MLRAVFLLVCVLFQNSSQASCQFWDEDTPSKYKTREQGTYVESVDDSGETRVVHWAKIQRLVSRSELSEHDRNPSLPVYLGYEDMVISKEHPLRKTCIDIGLDLPTVKDFEALRNCFVKNRHLPERSEILRIAGVLGLIKPYADDFDHAAIPSQTLPTRNGRYSPEQSPYHLTISDNGLNTQREKVYVSTQPTIRCVYHLSPNPTKHP